MYYIETDTVLLFYETDSHKNADQLLSIVNTELIKVVNWLKVNKLSLNVKKTQFILFHTRQKKSFQM